MNANLILNDSMSLDEKLAAIDLALKYAQEQADDEARSQGRVLAPIDPADALQCDGCQ